MENIRILVKTSDFASAFHDNITLTCDQNYFINDEKHLAGEEFTISGDDPVLDNGRIYIRPETNLARTSILSINRAQGIPAYRGNFEIVGTEDGLILINEVLLEEYLYSVVPSEMPSSYPSEALKAQAVCARTYAYDKMRKPGLMNYGAHVDDSAGFQVYNNIEENENTTLAIRETKDMILTYEGHLAEVYYYSTSCGLDLHMDLSEDSVFAAFLQEDKKRSVEAEEPMYRWKTSIRLADLQEKTEWKKITSLEITERDGRGMAVCLEVTGQKNTGEESVCEKIEGEYQIYEKNIFR